MTRQIRLWTGFLGWIGALLAATTWLGPGCVPKVIKNVNPCGTILNCDPVEYDLLMIDKYPDWERDPTCTIPGLCGGPFPIGGGVAVQGGAQQ